MGVPLGDATSNVQAYLSLLAIIGSVALAGVIVKYVFNSLARLLPRRHPRQPVTQPVQPQATRLFQTDPNYPWYRRIPCAELGSATCPRCGHAYPVGPIFDHDPSRCRGCQATLIEWNMMTVIYIIDPEHAPPIVQALIAHMAWLTEPEAEHALLELMRFLDVKRTI